jgi:hypothetical protein
MIFTVDRIPQVFIIPSCIGLYQYGDVLGGPIYDSFPEGLPNNPLHYFLNTRRKYGFRESSTNTILSTVPHSIKI